MSGLAETPATRPVVQELVPAPDPDICVRRAGALPWTIWMDSQVVRPGTARWSFLALDPFAVLRAHRGRVEWMDAGGTTTLREDALAALRRAVGACPVETVTGAPPFPGGAAGYFGYELGTAIEAIPSARHRDLDLPDMELGFYDVVLAWDRSSGRCWITSTGCPERGDRSRVRAERRLERMEAWAAGGDVPLPTLGPGAHRPETPRPDAQPPTPGGGPELRPVDAAEGLRSTFSADEYVRAVRTCVAYIRAGDVYQVNLSQRFQAPLRVSPLGLRERLAARNPAPFATYFAGSRCVLVGSSPERFLRLDPDGSVETRPIKGTRPRGPSPRRDAALARELESSPKDRAENLMITDLLRNDLSRTCRPRSVTVEALCRRETFPSVHHLVSVVRGRLERGRDAVDLLRACFPGGSVTGAPRIRSMEIIAELEPVTRGPYCGATGYLGFDGSMDTSIVIRSFVVAGRTAYFHAGGAVVADSDPVAEYRETLDKAASLVEAIRDPE
ncbi:MAG: anthranilate synthase component I family protein [Gemmatimonadota bacterium]